MYIFFKSLSLTDLRFTFNTENMIILIVYHVHGSPLSRYITIILIYFLSDDVVPWKYHMKKVDVVNVSGC